MGTLRYFEVLQGNFVHLNISGLSFGYLEDILRDSFTEFVQIEQNMYLKYAMHMRDIWAERQIYYHNNNPFPKNN